MGSLPERKVPSGHFGSADAGYRRLELCRRIRGHKQSKYTYIILLTALIGKKDYLEGMEAGADDFVTKPFDPDELKARLRVAERIISFQEQSDLPGAQESPGIA